jgi:hypothetical protein
MFYQPPRPAVDGTSSALHCYPNGAAQTPLSPALSSQGDRNTRPEKTLYRSWDAPYNLRHS